MAWRILAGPTSTETQAPGTTNSPLKRRGRDGFVYFDNDAKVLVPLDAQRFANFLA